LVQAKIKKGPIPPAMRALTTIIFIVVLLVVIGITIYNNKAVKKSHKSRRGE
jgi:ABC-type spermidine/putrescine transport system permease subunit II